jgi:aspartate carbamoyltransferase catalytic subunit
LLKERAGRDTIILHPLPRVGEIEVSVDTDKRAKYFEQMKNGLYIRMALLSEIL